ncbi:hypothetical protein PYW08_006289 [Mythimna loreyi]|uniref:Uncharacterized protein n=1 Tax=Mythimna loreyi TaxID=667449 RepID=A0ACC2QPU3_9NEOP|nr:hypothetical protein PYW08_006289 [Mythimna loreyi]
MTGKSESTVRRILKEGKEGKFSTPAKHRKGRPKIELDDFNLCAIRQKIQFSYTVQKEAPTLRKLLAMAKEELDYKGGHELLGEHGHEVVRLPLYHCDLNPIELICGIAKQKVAARNIGSIDIKKATEEAFNTIGPETWNKCVEHVKKNEQEYYERGRTLYEDIDRLIINVAEDSSDSDSSSDLDSSEDLGSVISGVEHLDSDSD